MTMLFGVSHPMMEWSHVRRQFERRANSLSALAAVAVLAILLLEDSSAWKILVPLLVAFWIVIHLIFQKLATAAEERQERQPFAVWMQIGGMGGKETDEARSAPASGLDRSTKVGSDVFKQTDRACLAPSNRGDPPQPPT
jgi:hypothetical protein